MIRRRFRTLGKYAVGSALPLLEDNESIPSIFSSRHGDTPLTMSLLEDIGCDQPISPTAFSLAVHNAVSGLFSIARKDTGETTSIAAMEFVVFQTICEALGQLQNADRVLCVLYDVPLPEFFGKYCAGVPFPYAIAIIVSQSGTQAFEMGPAESKVEETGSPENIVNSEPFAFLKLLTGLTDSVNLGPDHASWKLKRIADQR